jgi:hypothetical protein
MVTCEASELDGPRSAMFQDSCGPTLNLCPFLRHLDYNYHLIPRSKIQNGLASIIGRAGD